MLCPVRFYSDRCKRYAPLEIFGEGIPLSITMNIIIGLRYAFYDILSKICHAEKPYRVYALYGRNKYVAGVLAIYNIAEFSVAFWINTIPSIHRESCGTNSAVRQLLMRFRHSRNFARSRERQSNTGFAKCALCSINLTLSTRA